MEKKLTEKHVASVIARLSESGRVTVRKLWAACVPEGSYTDVEELAFIVAAQPYAAECSARFVALQLLIGPEFGSEFKLTVRPGVVHEWAEHYTKTFNEVSEMYRSLHNVPAEVSENGEWCCLCALREAIQRAYANGFSPLCMASDVEGIQSLACGWLHYIERDMKNAGRQVG